MTVYVEILANHPPIDIGIDENDRVMFSINVRAKAVAPITDWEQELVKILNTAGLATSGTDTWIGSDARIPAGDGPLIQIRDTGGLERMELQNGGSYERPTAQITVRAQLYPAARTRADAIWRELDGKRNLTVTL